MLTNLVEESKTKKSGARKIKTKVSTDSTVSMKRRVQLIANTIINNNNENNEIIELQRAIT